MQKIPVAGSQMELSATIVHHLGHVLRAVVGTSIILFDGNGGEYLASVQTISQKKVTVLIEQHSSVDRESPIETILAQTVVTGTKMDMLIQKAVELGVNKIVPVISERCTVQLKHKRAESRLQHWQGIIESACEQCGRTRLPELEKVTPLFPWAEEINSAYTKLVLQPDVKSTISGINKPDNAVLILIGPEGGLADDELSKLRHTDFISVHLGERILRTETAGLAALAAIQTLWGDFG